MTRYGWRKQDEGQPDERVVQAQKQLCDLSRGLLTEAAATVGVRDDVAPDVLTTFCLHAIAGRRRPALRNLSAGAGRGHSGCSPSRSLNPGSARVGRSPRHGSFDPMVRTPSLCAAGAAQGPPGSLESLTNVIGPHATGAVPAEHGPQSARASSPPGVLLDGVGLLAGRQRGLHAFEVPLGPGDRHALAAACGSPGGQTVRSWRAGSASR